MWLVSYMLSGHVVQIDFYIKEAVAEGAHESLPFFIGSFELRMSWQCCWLSKNITVLRVSIIFMIIKTKSKVIINGIAIYINKLIHYLQFTYFWKEGRQNLQITMLTFS